MPDYAALENKYALPLYKKRGLTLVRGEGIYVWDDHNTRYIDCTSGQGVAGVGHANPDVAAAVTEQVNQLLTCTGSFYNDQRALLMQELTAIAPKELDRVFLCNSGTESMEAAIKFARLHSDKTNFVCATKSFHGRSMGALSATHNPNYRKPFRPLVPGFRFGTYNDFDSFAAKADHNTAAVILELVQGEGGVNIANRDFVENIGRHCRQNKILLIIDEIQTGLGRTGKLFATEYFDIKPDMICLAKALGGGVPIGAVLCRSDLQIKYGAHGTTFGGNPLACAAARAALKIIRTNMLSENAEKMGTLFKTMIENDMPEMIREIRQVGLMIGIELKEKSQPYIDAMQKEGILVLPAGPMVIRLLPPLVINADQIKTVAHKLIAVLRSGINQQE